MNSQEEMGEPLALREVRIFGEFGAWPTWTEDEEGEVDNPRPADLGLSAELAEALEQWDEEFQAIYDASYPPDSAFPSEAAERDWVARGRALAVRVAAELGGAVEVHYREGGDEIVQSPGCCS